MNRLPPSRLAAGLLDVASHYALRLLPVPVVSAIGGWLGRTLGPRRREADARLRHNLRRLRPDISDPSAFEATVRRAWDNGGRCYAEFSAVRRLGRSDRIRFDGLEHLLDSRKTGRARIIIFLHLANWEILGPAFVDHGETGVQIYQPVLDPFKRWLAARIRAPYAAQMVEASPGGLRRIVRELDSKGALSIAVDEYIAGEVYAPAFGRPLHMDGNLARTVRLARRSDALVHLAWAERTSGCRFTVHILPPLPIAFGTLAEEQIEPTVRRLDEIISPIVLRQIDQWFMLDNLRLDRST